MRNWFTTHSTDFMSIALGLWILASVVSIAYIMGLIGNNINKD